MEMCFGSKGIHNFLEVSLEGVEQMILDGNYYKTKMLENNKIYGLIQPTTLEINERLVLKYDTESLYVLGRLLTKIKPDGEFLKLIIGQIMDCVDNLENYLLTGEDLVLDINYMMYDGNNRELRLIYVPGYKVSIKTQLGNLLEHIMKIFDHRDRQGMVFMYKLHDKLLEEESGIKSIKKILVDEMGKEYSETKNEIHIPQEDKEIKPIRDVLEEKDYFREKILAIAITIVVGVAIFFALQFFCFRKTIFNLYMFIGLVIIAIILTVFFSLEEKENVDEIMSQFLDEVSYEEKELVKVEEVREEVVREDIKRLVPLTNGGLDNINITQLGETIIIGRGKKESDYRLPKTEISRIHACIYNNPDGCYVEDRASTNGTFLNNNRLPALSPQKIKKGDVISFADEEFFAS